MASSSSSSSGLTKDGFNDYNAGLQAAALKATKHSAGLPSDVAFYRSIDKDFANNLDACSERALSLVNRLLSLASTADSSRSGKGKGKARLEDQDDLVDRFESIIVESMDQLLERADVSLDHFSGRTKAPAIAVKPPPPVPKRNTLAPTPVVQHAAHLPKPQLKFKRKPVNTNGAVWYPQLRHKYNAQVPLGYNFNPNDPESEKAIPPHPYRHEITNITYPSRMFETQSPITPKSFAETPFTWVFTPVDFATMLDKLRNAQEIAVDLEYHSYRTFGGFVCLMQISSREEDWIVDPFELRDEMEDLNEVFTDPKIVKIFHGAESDIAWLQQDFNLYIVNLFDTFHASKVLDFPRHGLASLLEMYCDFTADKRYQLADWRVRPLPQEMLEYARSDTHFLLYIYDNLRNALLDRFLSRSQSRAQSPQSSSTPPPPTTINPSSTVTSLIPPGPDGYVREVLSRSAETSLRVYEREYYDVEGGSGPGGWDTMAKKWNKVALVADGPGGVQREVYRAVHAWRDRTAREEDESTRYVLANHFVFQLAERPPNDMAALLHMFHSVPPVIRRRAKELLDCIRVALKRGLTATTPQTPSPIEPTSAPTTLNTPAGMDVDSTASTAVPSVAPPSSSLWSKPSNPTTQSTSASSLFGSALSSSITSKTPIHPPSATASSYVAPRSSLFGRGASSSAASGSSRARDVKSVQSRFQDVVKKIHSTLVVAPTLPQVPVNVATNTVTNTTNVDDAMVVDSTVSGTEVMPPKLIDGATEEIPFIPTSQRLKSTLDTTEIDNAIVVVGQRQKKRKRDKVAGTSTVDSQPGTPSTKSSKKAKKEKEKEQANEQDGEEGEEGEVVEMEPFDYAGAKNILDDEPEAREESRRDKKKKQKRNNKGSGVLEYGNFPAPPRDRREVKSGNQSHTFK